MVCFIAMALIFISCFYALGVDKVYGDLSVKRGHAQNLKGGCIMGNFLLRKMTEKFFSLKKIKFFLYIFIYITELYCCRRCER